MRGRERSVYRGALGLALAAALTIALGAGVFIGSSSAAKRSAQDLAELRDEIRSLRSTVALALLSEPSASERLNGVAYGRELQGEDRRVADALFTTLLEDPNVNVRLAALDALREVSARPDTRARLVQSIPAAGLAAGADLGDRRPARVGHGAGLDARRARRPGAGPRPRRGGAWLPA